MQYDVYPNLSPCMWDMYPYVLDVQSDFDFLVEFDDAAPAAYAQAFFGLKTGLEALFHRPVDLVTPSNLANPFFRRRIAAESETLYVS